MNDQPARGVTVTGEAPASTSRRTCCTRSHRYSLLEKIQRAARASTRTEPSARLLRRTKRFPVDARSDVRACATAMVSGRAADPEQQEPAVSSSSPFRLEGLEGAPARRVATKIPEGTAGQRVEEHARTMRAVARLMTPKSGVYSPAQAGHERARPRSDLLRALPARGSGRRISRPSGGPSDQDGSDDAGAD